MLRPGEVLFTNNKQAVKELMCHGHYCSYFSWFLVSSRLSFLGSQSLLLVFGFVGFQEFGRFRRYTTLLVVRLYIPR